MDAESIYNIINRKGIDATIRTYPSKSFDPDTNLTTLGSETDYAVKIVPPYRYIKEGFKVTTLVTWGKGITGIANFDSSTKGALAFTMESGLKIIINSKEWTIISFTPIQDSLGILFYSLNIESGN